MSAINKNEKSRLLNERETQRLRLGAIAYINTIPIYRGFEPAFGVELHYDSPARLNAMVNAGELDVSPVSSAYYLRHQDELTLIPNLSVSSYGAVESVLFLSQTPIDSPEFLQQMPSDIAITADSETSVNLLAWVLEQKTGQDLRQYFQTYPADQYEAALAQYGCALVIGDHALLIHEKPELTAHYHIYDLSREWVTATSLPFVFAVWVARKSWAPKNQDCLETVSQQLSASRDAFFNNADLFQQGIDSAAARCQIPRADIESYFLNALNYTFTDDHRASLKAFEKALDAKQVAVSC